MPLNCCPSKPLPFAPQILCKLPVLAPPLPLPSAAGAPAPAGAVQLEIAAAVEAGQVASRAAAPGAPALAAGTAQPDAALAGSPDWVPACPVLAHLQPAKLAVYQALVQQGLSVAQVGWVGGAGPGRAGLGQVVWAPR